MRTVIHDGRGRWLRPEDALVSSLSNGSYAALCDADGASDFRLPGQDTQALLGYDGRGTWTVDDLLRVLTCWLPNGTLHEMDGRLVIDTGLREAPGSGVLELADA